MPADDAICPICRVRPADSEEHIWPKWFLKRLDQQGPPAGHWAVNGVPLVKDGQMVRYGTRTRVLLRICAACNSELDRRFEKSAKPVVSDLALNRWAGEHTEQEWQTAGLWWAKVLLLFGHPQARLGDHYLNHHAANPKLRFEQPLPDITWLTDGSAQPDHLSVFVFNADPDNDEQEHTLAVPELVVGDGGTVEHCHVINFATAGLGVSLLSHPGLIIDHPLVRSGQAWELLHSPPASGADLIRK